MRIIFLSLLMSFCSLLNARTITVGVNEEFTSLQPAIDAAKSGDVILIKEGIYETEYSLSINQKQNLTIKGEGDVNLWCKDFHTVVLYISDSKNINITGLNMVHADLATSEYSPGGCSAGVLTIFNCENITVSKCTINGCGTIGVDLDMPMDYNKSKNLVIENCHIYNNSLCAVHYNGEYYYEESEIKIPHAVFRNNKMESNGIGSYVFRNPYYEVMMKYLRKSGKNLRENPYKNMVSEQPIIRLSGTIEGIVLSNAENIYDGLRIKDAIGREVLMHAPYQLIEKLAAMNLTGKKVVAIWEDALVWQYGEYGAYTDYDLIVADVLLNGSSVLDAGKSERYICAPSGLNLRNAANKEATLISNIPYGEKVKLLDEKAGQALTVDGISGNMVAVEYKGTKGYVFDGYLAAMPYFEYDMFEWAKQLTRMGITVEFNHSSPDMMSTEEELSFPAKSFGEALLVAYKLFTPHYLEYPKDSKAAEQTITIPPTKEEVENEYPGERSLKVFRDAKGEITEVEYTGSYEVGYTSFSLRKRGNNFILKMESAGG